MRTTVVFIKKLLGNTPDTNYITLKEAARISGYSSDYVGQLIRAGKLPGKQIYSNIAWVTTEDAIGRYIEGQGTPEATTASHASKLQWWWRRSTLDTDRLTRIVLSLIVAVLTLILIVFMYIGSLALDRVFSASSIERHEAEQVIDKRFYEAVPFRLSSGPPDG